MGEHVHIIPVGFDFDRLVYPITKGELEADRVILVTHIDDTGEEETTKEAELAVSMAHELERTFDLLDITVELRPIEVSTLRKYEELYPLAHELILRELGPDDEVYVNISSMPRTTAFAFATAADSIITEYKGDIVDVRSRLHTYYVAPERYLVIKMIEVLEETRDTLEGLKHYEDITVHSLYNEVQNTLRLIEENGVTQGAKELDGQLYVEFPSAPRGDVEGFEADILKYLSGADPVPSTSALAEQLADHLGTEYDEAFRSRVQYNVGKLEELGYVDREKVGNSLETELSTMGRLWVKTH